MFIDDLLHLRAHLSTGKNHPKIFSPTASATSSAAPTPDNRSIASNEKKNKKRLSIFSSSSGSSKPLVKAANCGAGMKLPSNIVQTKDHSLHYQQIRPIIH